MQKKEATVLIKFKKDSRVHLLAGRLHKSHLHSLITGFGTRSRAYRTSGTVLALCFIDMTFAPFLITMLDTLVY